MAPEQGSTTSDKHVAHMIVGVLGGTGDQGRGLAYRLAAAGNPVIIGSRHAERAQAAAEELGGGAIRGLVNADVAREADVVIVAGQNLDGRPLEPAELAAAVRRKLLTSKE